MKLTHPQSIYGLDEYNVLFVTLDCCRYDTFQMADLPFMKSLGIAAKAYTHGTYTLPAHMSFFMGDLPIASDSNDPYYNSNVRQLWRLGSGRARSMDSLGIILDGRNILDGYKNLGFYTLGTGGVRWFLNPTLPSLFDRFLYFGPDDKKSVFTYRKKSELPLNNQTSITDALKDKKRYFLFVNCLETHVPYDFGEGAFSKETERIINKAQPIWGGKQQNLHSANVTPEELKKLHYAQVKALESIDAKLQNLVVKLAGPLLIVITGDHGECFGEDYLWGHGFPHQKVHEVPLLITFLDK